MYIQQDITLEINGYEIPASVGGDYTPSKEASYNGLIPGDPATFTAYVIEPYIQQETMKVVVKDLLPLLPDELIAEIEQEVLAEMGE